MCQKLDKNILERWYRLYNNRRYLETDPVRIVHRFDNTADREIVALITACLAYGRVKMICDNVTLLTSRLGTRPALYLESAETKSISKICSGFHHRFTGEEDMFRLLQGIRDTRLRHGSLKNCFLSHSCKTNRDVIPALAGFVNEISTPAESIPHLLPSPGHGSACKRLMLFLRWMVRSDQIDTGDWAEVGREKLLLPIDTHMRKICQTLGLTRRRQVDLQTAREATGSFQKIRPDDPVRYDFSLTRIAMQKGIKAIENAT